MKFRYSLKTLIVVVFICSGISWCGVQFYKQHLQAIAHEQEYRANAMVDAWVKEEIDLFKRKFPGSLGSTYKSKGQYVCRDVTIARGNELHFDELLYATVYCKRVGDNQFLVELEDHAGAETADFLKSLAKRFPPDRFQCKFIESR